MVSTCLLIAAIAPMSIRRTFAIAMRLVKTATILQLLRQGAPAMVTAKR